MNILFVKFIKFIAIVAVKSKQLHEKFIIRREFYNNFLKIYFNRSLFTASNFYKITKGFIVITILSSPFSRITDFSF